MVVDRLRYALAWLRRLPQSRGFGIQSPTDYRFARYVVGEQWPYYAYERMGEAGDWVARKTGRLCLRLANERQPATVLDLVGLGSYATAGCARARVTHHLEAGRPVELAIVPMSGETLDLLRQCDSRSVVVFCGIRRQKALWRSVESSPLTVVTYDLYHCGIALFDNRQTKRNYQINY